MMSISGEMLKYGSSLSDATSTVRVRRQISQAMADDGVKGILLVIDSPGGTVAGTSDLADAVSAAAAKKPVHGYCEDLCASAAYWVGSQTARLSAGKSALVGSIGTFAVIQDSSGWAAQKGIKIHVVRAGEGKGAGTPGTEVTAAQLAEWQRVVDGLNEHFVAGVSAGRKMPIERARTLADGRIHVGAEAKALGLVDAIETLDEAMAVLALAIEKPQGAKPAPRRSASMSVDNTATAPVASAPVAATLKELKAACVGAGDAFLVQQLEAEATLAVATSAWMAEQNAQLTAARQEAAEAKAAATAASAKPTETPKAGVAPLETVAGTSQAQDTADPIQAWNEAIEAKVAAGRTRMAAIAELARSQPDLRASYLEAFNAANKPTR
jgi:signal peptide peptidase SppA